MVNSVVLQGRLTRDPDVRTTNSGVTVARFTVACDDSRSREKRADFPSCVAFGKTAEFIEDYFYKGKMILIEGKLQTGSYENKNGDTVYTTDVIVNQVNFCGDNRRDDDSYSGGSGRAESVDAQGFEELDDDEELPF